MICYEEDKIQCQELTDMKKRCSRIGTHSGGGKIRCERHHQIFVRDRANAQPIVRKAK